MNEFKNVRAGESWWLHHKGGHSIVTYAPNT